MNFSHTQRVSVNSANINSSTQTWLEQKKEKKGTKQSADEEAKFIRWKKVFHEPKYEREELLKA